MPLLVLTYNQIEDKMMNEIAKLYFQYKDGTDDSIILEAPSIPEMNDLADKELDKRGATFTGIECLQQCSS